jgi:hypothetical protein
MLSSQKNTVWCDYCAPPLLEKPRRAANACTSWASRPASASTPTSMSTTQTRHRARVRSSPQQQRCSEPCPRPQHLRRETCTARRRLSSSRRPYNRPKARHPTYASRAVCGTTAAPKAKRRPSTRVAWRGNQPTRAERRSWSGSLIRAGRPRTVTPATSSTLAERATRRHGGGGLPP